MTSYAAENCSVFGCVLKVAMVAELFVTANREFQTAGANQSNKIKSIAWPTDRGEQLEGKTTVREMK